MNIFEMMSFSSKILGMNSRNLSYIKPHNRRKWIRLVDNKIRFKKALEKADIPTPKLINIIRNQDILDSFDYSTLPKSFVLKPASGFGGDGIVVLFGEHKKKTSNGERQWVKTKGNRLTETDIHNHIRNILDGAYSRNNTPDIAFLEERIQLNKSFKPLAYRGIPDIRVIVFNRIPIMAMLRIPTRESDGKANLHQGGIGVGIDMANGVTTNAIMRERFIDTIPGKDIPLSGIQVPYWNKILEIAVRTADVTNLGFTGVDIAIDRDKGPVVLEANARPGLAIQIANLTPLKERLERVKNLKVKTLKRAVRLAKDLFGGEIEEEIEELTGRQVIGLTEEIILYAKDGTKHTIMAKIDTGADKTSIDESLAIELGYSSVLDHMKQFNIKPILTIEEIDALSQNKTWQKIEEHPDIVGVSKVRSSHGYSYRPIINVKMKIGDEIFETKINIISRSNLSYPVILGKNSIKKFFIDPRK